MLTVMFSMIVKMSSITFVYVAVTFLLWKALTDRKMGMGDKIALGFIYGILSVFSTHVGVDYGNMVLNVRDLGPMAAGLFFDPLSGIIAGMIGGIERYIVGTYFEVGAYTRIACSISTCFAGFFAAFLHIFIFKREKPSIAYAFFMGSVIEVFHMYVVFLTHRDDMRMAFDVVRICSVPMILFKESGRTSQPVYCHSAPGSACIQQIPDLAVRGNSVCAADQFRIQLCHAVSFRAPGSKDQPRVNCARHRQFCQLDTGAGRSYQELLAFCGNRRDFRRAR